MRFASVKCHLTQLREEKGERKKSSAFRFSEVPLHHFIQLREEKGGEKKNHLSFTQLKMFHYFLEK